MTMNITNNVPDQHSERTWYNENSAYVFLVDKPITFGHSQLIFSIPPGISEEDAFNLAAKHVAMCIGRFRSTFERLDLGEWNSLAQYTITSGRYVKTLVLKASANEKQKEEYKLHLVPCFSSHIDTANKLFWARFGKEENGGGLLYWIGQREHLVDFDKSQKDSKDIVQRRIQSFYLTGLAAVLRCPAHSAETA
jgi:hypothetical protein